MVEQRLIDTLWILICSMLVFIMQPGFACLESGLTRAKNTINVAIKNLTDFGISSILFWALGFGFMFGESQRGLIGSTHFLLSFGNHSWWTAFFLFELVFCGTSTTIISGAVAERMRFRAYLVSAAIVSCLIYPVFGHWAWNGLENNVYSGWLGKLGFRDFAGSTVVHSLAGWISLSALILIGPREGRFPKNAPPRKISGHDIPVSVLGVFLLWLGWLGFNGGSTFALNDAVSRIITNTILAGAGGMVTTLAIGWGLKRLPHIEFVINGSLAGCVAITASCYFVDAAASVVIGAIGGIVMLATEALLERLRIDDAVGAIPVHLGAGIWGTLAVAVFGSPSMINTGLSPLQQLSAQGLGIAVCGLWAFGTSFIAFYVLNRFIRLRVSPEEEYSGLNVSEHGSTTELLDFFRVMERQIETGDLSLRAPVEPFTEAGQIAQRYNSLIETLENASRELKEAYLKLRQSQSQLIQSSKMATVGQLSSGIAHEINNPLSGALNNIQLLKMQLGQERGLETADAKKLLNTVEECLSRCRKITTSLLSFSRASKGLFQPVSLNDAARKIIDILEYEIKLDNISIQTLLQPDLPLVMGDSQFLQQVIFDLISNARWALLHKTPSENQVKTITITSSYDGQNQKVILKLSDTGPGIPEENLAKIFEPFFTTKPEGEGTGLGLSIVAHIIKEHRGTIEVKSQLNQGTTFKISLPTATP